MYTYFVDLGLDVLGLGHGLLEHPGEAWPFLCSQLVYELTPEAVRVDLVLVDRRKLMVTICVTLAKNMAIAEGYEIIEAHFSEKPVLFDLLARKPVDFWIATLRSSFHIHGRNASHRLPGAILEVQDDLRASFTFYLETAFIVIYFSDGSG